MPFLTAGYPDLEATDALLDAVVAGGADLIELGIPFSDPLADGATIQHTSQVALDNGTTLADCFAIARRFRERGHDTPIVFMGYTNPFLQYGPGALAEAAVANGVDGFIIPDLPLEESDEFSAPLRAHGRDLIFLVAPTSTDDRIKEAASRASGFIYCVALTGVTGARSELCRRSARIHRADSHRIPTCPWRSVLAFPDRNMSNRLPLWPTGSSSPVRSSTTSIRWPRRSGATGTEKHSCGKWLQRPANSRAE